MDKIVIRGGQSLKGRLQISGAKNAALTLIPAALLTEEPLTLRNLPRLADVDTFGHLVNQLGTSTEIEGKRPEVFGRVMTLKAGRITSTTAPPDITRKMRASILVLGPLLGRMGEAKVPLPGGCEIGARPIDLHLKAMEALGAEIDVGQSFVTARTKNGLKGGRIDFPLVSVGATENALMAAVLAQGDSEIVNAAREPEIVDLANCLIGMGAKIEGAGTDTIHIKGVPTLHGDTYRVMSDRIEAGSYACAAAITGGDVELAGAAIEDFEAVVDKLRAAGVTLEPTEDGLRVTRDGPIEPVDITTAPYPDFPTDMQAQMMAMLTLARGSSVLTETIFENRYMHVGELERMGADIQVSGRTATVRGVSGLKGAAVMATDLRASMSLIIAGLAAEGTTEVLRVQHLDRGYERLEEKLSAVGADIQRASGD
ncbi:UDP-N-acetylglucosamine 1-carboxyvinyltransferase [Pacificimonas flava]|uniref:UDP-N-acetylglucosamine 1-carboxyvinyltransferase n=2 Tax=Pacificimonas TaxID=1960290 RepID=A0A219B3B2_9SPHN|nr:MULTISPECIES: UDP-N-acetylglucosamine 1-carboxyvinyltransferase [Pacificimonas]MBZ6377652.1 UDP-N-acetylglucosamine 1-carboxyvinyltransferase [Pacificimonas aurantium]OWV32664.1 UDP-N-acetylglucosamine 1-carboxyvinyltransferase [Pacificimonas flava]